MAIPSSITDLDTNEAMNSPAGSDNVGGTLDNFLRSHAAIIRRQFSKGADINSASTTVLPPDCSFANVVKVVSTINGFSDNFNGRIVCLKFDAGITLAHSSSLVLPTAANIVTEAGDVAFFINESAGVWRCIGYLALLQRSVTNAAKASGTSFTPAGNLVATNVQAALQELDAEKQNALGYTPLNKAGDTATGPLASTHSLALSGATSWLSEGWGLAADIAPGNLVRFKSPQRYFGMGATSGYLYLMAGDAGSGPPTYIFTANASGIVNFTSRPTVASSLALAYAGVAGAHIGTITEYGAVGTGTVSTVVTSSPQVMIGLRGNGAGLFYPQGRAYQMV